MTALLEIRERIRIFCAHYDIYLKAVLKVLLGFFLYSAINRELGYNARVDSGTLVAVLSLAGAILPINFLPLAASVMVILHLYALGPAVAIVGAVFFVIAFLVYFRFSPRSGYLAALTPLANLFHVPYLMPFVAGLTDDNPTSAISVLMGTFFYHFLKGVKANSASLSQMGEEDTLISKINETVSQVIDNREMMVMMGVLCLASVVIWALRRLSVDHAWVYAISIGALVELIGVIVGASLQNFSIEIPNVILGVAISTAIGFVLRFFLFNLDYDRTERVQFEDDEYYYYVKAVPKRNVAMGRKELKTYASTDDITKEDVMRDMQDE